MKSMKKYARLMTGKSFFSDVSYTVVGQVVVMALALLINKVVSNYLQPAEFAVFSIANRTASVLAFIMLLGLGIAIPRYMASARAKGDKRSERALFYSSCLLMFMASALVFIVVMVGGGEFARVVFGEISYESLVLPTLLFALGITLSTFVYSYFRGVDKFKQYNVLQIVFQAVSLSIVIISGTNIALQIASRGVVLGVLSLIILVYITLVIYKRGGVAFKKIKDHSVDLLSYCLPRVPGEAFLFSFTTVPLVIINAKFGLHATAAFATAITLNAIVVPLFQFVGLVLLPYVSKNLVHGKMSDIQDKISKLRRLYVAVGVLSAAVMLIFADIVISILFSHEYAQFSSVIRIVYLSVIPYSLYLLLRNPLDAISKVPFNTFNLGISFGLLVVMILLAPDMYICAIAFTLSYLVLGLLSEASWAWQFKKMKNKTIDVVAENGKE